jgi:hypothetical protein
MSPPNTDPADSSREVATASSGPDMAHSARFARNPVFAAQLVRANPAILDPPASAMPAIVA